jgi:hypothetical protein
MILIVSHHQNPDVQAVMRALRRAGEHAVRVVDLSDFPMRMDLTIEYGHDRRPSSVLRFADGSRVALDDVTAVWWHRPQPFSLPEAVADPVHRDFALREAQTAWRGFWQTGRALWINDIGRHEAALPKPGQLVAAREVGLSIPDTLITNNPDEARRFWSRYRSEIVYKAFTAIEGVWRETRLLGADEQSLAEAIRLTPVIFQRYVAAVVELRITVVGQRLFAAEIHCPQGEYPVDVRMNRGLPCRPHDLPEDITRKLMQLISRFGLEFGAIDMRVTPEGEYVFLEINPVGEFGHVEGATGLPIARAVAERLAEGRAGGRRNPGFKHASSPSEHGVAA